MGKIFPTKHQYKKWTLPSKYALWGLVVSVIGLVASTIGSLGSFISDDHSANYIKVDDEESEIVNAYYVDYNGGARGMPNSFDFYLSNGIVKVSDEYLGIQTVSREHPDILVENSSFLLHLKCTDNTGGGDGIFKFKDYYFVDSDPLGTLGRDICGVSLQIDTNRDRVISYNQYAQNQPDEILGNQGYVSFLTDGLKFNFKLSNDTSVEGRYAGKFTQLRLW